MIQHILKQLWNKRRANAWIFLELVLVTFFMWGVIDPVYVLLSNKAIDPGYDIDQVFRLTIGQCPATTHRFDKTMDTDSIRKACLLHIYDQVRNYPGVEAAVITDSHQYPLSGTMISQSFNQDSVYAKALILKFYRDGEFFRVFRMHDAHTGEIPDHRQVGSRHIYITRNMEKELCPEGHMTGKDIYTTMQYTSLQEDTVFYTVKGMMSGFKHTSIEQPRNTAFIPSDDISVDELPWSSQICFRIRDGLSKAHFAEQFKQEMTPRMRVGNLYFLRLTDFETIYTHREFEDGVTNTLRLQTGLALFFLICIFLGIAGTFWLRSDARKAEIGLRMALGSSRRNIFREFLTESWLLTTVAWIIGIFIVLQKVYITGFAGEALAGDGDYLQNRFGSHFLIVSFIVYILILCIALMGTWIPARQAASVQPSDALRDE